MFTRFVTWSVILAVIGSVSTIRAEESDEQGAVREDLEKQLSPMAELIVRVMQSESPQLTSISFGEFGKPAGPQSAYAVGMRQSLIDVVKREASKKKYEIQVLETGALQVSATMHNKHDLHTDKDTIHPSAIQVRFTIDKATGRLEVPDDIKTKLDNYQKTGVVITNPNIVAGGFGLTSVFRPGASKEADLAQARKSLDTPTFQIGGETETRLKASPSSKYSVEILVVDAARLPKNAKDWNDIKPRRITKTADKKFPFIKLEEGEAYAIRIHNESGFDAAVQIQIDGLDVFSFVDDKLRKSDGQPKYNCYIVPRPEHGGYGVIPGWHKDNEESLSFVVREHGKGAVSKIKTNQGAPGMIHISIAGAWNKDEDANVPDEVRGRDAGKKETDTGAPVKTGFVEVQKEIGKYNTHLTIVYSH